MLWEFINQDYPLIAMLEWLAHQLMQIEAEGKLQASKDNHSKERQTFFRTF